MRDSRGGAHNRWWGWAYIDGRKWLNRGVKTNRDLHFRADQDGPAADALEVSDCGQYLAREAQCSGKRWLRLVLPTKTLAARKPELMTHGGVAEAV